MKQKLFFFSLAYFLFTTIFVPVVSAHEASIAATVKPVEYALPYPGMLPGSPLYFFKSMRDNLMRFFISDPLKKAEFELLQADKALSASLALFEQGETTRASASLHESLSNFEKAIKQTEEAKKEGIAVSDFVARMTLAGRKHEEVIIKLSQVDTGKNAALFAQTLTKIHELEKKVTTLRPQE